MPIQFAVWRSQSRRGPTGTKVVLPDGSKKPPVFVREGFGREEAVDLEDLPEMIAGLSANEFIVRGMPITRRRGLRRKVTSSGILADVARNWIMVDLDGVPGSIPMLPDPVPAFEAVIARLPDEFADRSFVWQLSSSAPKFDSKTAK